MNFLIFACSVGLIFLLNYLARDMKPIKQRFVRLLQFARVAPILAFFVLLILVLTYFHTKTGIRLSHAWFAAQFWAYTAFLYCTLATTKNRVILLPMIITFIIAVYNTPLFHYEKLFTGNYVIVSDIFGVLMFLAMWIATTKIITRQEVMNESVSG